MPDQSLHTLVKDSGLSVKDAKTLVGLDDGDRLDYFYTVIDYLKAMVDGDLEDYWDLEKMAANW